LVLTLRRFNWLILTKRAPFGARIGFCDAAR